MASSSASISAVVELVEVVRLPVVARTGREQRIERRLPARERHGPDHLADRLAERAQRRDRGFSPLAGSPSVAEREHEHLACRAPRPGRNGSGGALRMHEPHRELVRRGRDELAVGLEQRAAPGRTGARSAPRAPAGRSACSRYSNDVTTPKLPPPPRIAQNRSGLSVALARDAVLPSAVTTSAAIRLSMVSPSLRLSQPNPPPSVRPAMPGRRVDAERQSRARTPASPRRNRRASRRDRRGAVRAAASTRDRLHGREVEHQPALAHRVARDVVAAALDREQEPVLAREVHGQRRRPTRRPRARWRRACGRSSRSRSCAPRRSPRRRAGTACRAARCAASRDGRRAIVACPPSCLLMVSEAMAKPPGGRIPISPQGESRRVVGRGTSGYRNRAPRGNPPIAPPFAAIRRPKYVPDPL